MLIGCVLLIIVSLIQSTSTDLRSGTTLLILAGSNDNILKELTLRSTEQRPLTAHIAQVVVVLSWILEKVEVVLPAWEE